MIMDSLGLMLTLLGLERLTWTRHDSHGLTGVNQPHDGRMERCGATVREHTLPCLTYSWKSSWAGNLSVAILAQGSCRLLTSIQFVATFVTWQAPTPPQSTVMKRRVEDDDSILALECAQRPMIDLTDDGSDTEPDCYSTQVDTPTPEEAPAPSSEGDAPPHDFLLAVLAAPTPPPSPAMSSSFDSEDTANDDPCAPHVMTGGGGAIAAPWHSDPSEAKKIDDLVDIGVQERWLTRGCMDRTLGLEFEAAAGEAMAYIASVVASFAAFKVGITCDPPYRWNRKDKNKHGFVGHRWHFEGMDLVYVSPHSKAEIYGSAGHMERVLIERCHEMWANVFNTLPGGEGAPRASPVFVYIAWRCSDESGVSWLGG